ncbi:MAG: phosphoglycerate mutase family protein [Myxococcales bacterium]|nr:phosphoglycerate mutase family protein [Myxococcales bacterium]MDD9965192.1 phosphoglycerate mutase family protein [Myxococcales bacterium]
MAHVIAALCRHGIYEQPADTPSAHLLYPLTDEGRVQARTLAEQLQKTCSKNGWVLDPLLDTSSLQRAYQTAELCAAQLSTAGRLHTVEQFDALTERCLGAAGNLSVPEIEAVIEGDPRFDRPPAHWKSMSDYRLPFPGAESLLDAGHRCARHLRARTDSLRARVDCPTVKVFVGHGAAFRHAAVSLGALPLPTATSLSMYYGRPVFLATAESGPWKHLAGEWKPRSKAQRPD